MNFHGFAPAHKTSATASAARVSDDFAFSATLRAGRISDRPPKQGIDHSLNLSGTLAGRASLHVGSISGSTSAAIWTRPVALYSDILVAASGYLAESQADTSPDVTTFVDFLLRTARRAATKIESAETSTECTPEKII